MSPRALKIMAKKWFLLGFKHSGRGFHGEIYDSKKYPRIKSILEAEFERVWGTK